MGTRNNLKGKSAIAALWAVLLLAGCGGGGSGGAAAGPDMSVSGCPAGVSCLDACAEAIGSVTTDEATLCKATCDEGDSANLQNICSIVNESRGNTTAPTPTTNEACNDPNFDCVQGCKDINIECMNQTDDQDLTDVCTEQCQDEWFSDLACSYVNDPAGICAFNE